MQSLFRKFTEPSYALMRIAFGGLFAFHGAQKLFGAFGGSQADSVVMWIAGAVEFVGGLAIAVGLFASPAALLACGQMFIGYLWKHQPNALLPIQNRGELALLYAFAFLFILCRGAGIWSVDKKNS